MKLAKGTLVGKYQLERPLAQGGMGSVWTARHVTLGQRVAVKFIAPGLGDWRSSLARFEREAHAAIAIQSSHVVQVQDFGLEQGTPYLVMELLRGEHLGARLRRVGRLPLDRACNVLIQVAKALRRAHAAGIVHRDLKPDNLFLASEDDDEEVVKILDFGIAKTTNAPLSENTDPGLMLGCPSYVSPEQATGDEDIDHRSDLWSVGVVLYETVTGVLPFRGRTARSVLEQVFAEQAPRMAEVAPDLPPELDGFFDKALAKSKADRFQSVGELTEAFMAIAAPDEAVPPSCKGPPNDAFTHPPSGDVAPVDSCAAPAASDEQTPPVPASLHEVPYSAPTAKLRRDPPASGPPQAPPPEDPPTSRSEEKRVRTRAGLRRALPWLLVAALLAVAGLSGALRVTVATSPPLSPARPFNGATSCPPPPAPAVTAATP